MRATQNCLTRCFGGIQQSDEHARIKLKEFQMANRKKQFGVDYMTRVLEQDASPEQLSELVEQCKADLIKEQREIDTLQAEIARINNETKAKIQPKPTTTTSTAAAATTASTAATTPSTATLAAPDTATPTPLATIPEPVVAEAPSPAATASTEDVVPVKSSEPLATNSSDSGQITTESI